jgi:hypothetical protein
MDGPYRLPWQELLSCKLLSITAAADILQTLSLKSHISGHVVPPTLPPPPIQRPSAYTVLTVSFGLFCNFMRRPAYA